MEELWSQRARTLEPYVPGEQPTDTRSWIKLNTNENPYPPSPKTLQAAQESLDARLRLYPDPDSTALRQAIAKNENVAIEQVFVGNGSDEVLAICFEAFFDPDKAVRIPDITYFFYEIYAKHYDISLDIVPLEDDFSLDPHKLEGATGGVVFPNPNAPTGMAMEPSDIERIVKQNRRVVIVDEAYVDFGAKSAVPLLAENKNLLIVKTFSKSHSLAGMRVGYALGSVELIAALERVKNAFNSFPLDRVAQAAAQAAIEDTQYYNRRTEMLIQTRERSKTALEERGFDVLPSKGNFLFATHTAQSAASIQTKLREKGVMVRRFQRPRIENYLRITIGTDEEMDILMEALDTLRITK